MIALINNYDFTDIACQHWSKFADVYQFINRGGYDVNVRLFKPPGLFWLIN